ncbi:MAG: hypothetical protein JJU28_08140 [Cyclobacteriaceae bacterium]|nr:hypothetical protein [Cyclobacteriaceae bacterium]
MKAIVCNNYGGPEVLRRMDVAKPACGKKELLIQVMARAVNSADSKVRAAKNLLLLDGVVALAYPLISGAIQFPMSQIN